MNEWEQQYDPSDSFESKEHFTAQENAQKGPQNAPTRKSGKTVSREEAENSYYSSQKSSS